MPFAAVVGAAELVHNKKENPNENGEGQRR